MEELNSKLGENMESLEEQSAWSLSRVQQDVKDLAAKVDDASYMAEAEVRKLEARLESTWRERLSEVEKHIQDVSDRSVRSDLSLGGTTEKLTVLEGRVQECLSQAEAGESTLKQIGQRLDSSSNRLEELQTLTLEHIG